MPNMMMFMKMGGNVPTGWSYNPSSWPQRSIMIGLAFIGWLASRYLGAFQLGYIDTVWDPFFGEGTLNVLNSDMSHSFPISDAGLGTLAYTLEFLMGFMGGTSRWRTMPWLVLLFGIMIIPLGVISITFIIIQPILLNTWCTLCLIAAVAMLVQVPYSFDELIATSMFLWRRWKAGRPILRILFVGDSDVLNKNEKKEDNFEQSPKKVIKLLNY
jgi:magnesium-transporting ATPase (P-type)